MIQAYAFLAMFTVQILVISVLQPAWFTRQVQSGMESSYSNERFAQLYPGIERTRVTRFLGRYRMVNAAIALLGLLVLGWFFNLMRRPDWNEGAVKALLSLYVVIQVLPVLAFAVLVTRMHGQAFKRWSPEPKRTASLQRRGLFDFVSPFAVFLAVLVYALYVVLNLYIERHPFPGYGGAILNIGIITLLHVAYGILIYRRLYAMKSTPLETSTDRMRMTALLAKSCVYTCIVFVALLSLGLILKTLELNNWGPLVMSGFFVTIMLLSSCLIRRFGALPPRAQTGSAPLL